MKRFEVHSHTHYSNLRLLDCINRPEALVKRAVELGLAGIAITDHEALCSHIELNMLQKDYPDFKIALGNEIYLVDERKNGQDYYHFILIAKDKIGHKQMRELSSLAWLNSYQDGMERVPTLKSDLKKIISENPGHIIATTACIGGELSKSILTMENARKVGDKLLETNSYNQIVTFIKNMKEIFGSDFYIECAPGRAKDQVLVNKKLKEIAEFFGIKMVIGTDAHYLTKNDRYVHKAYLNSHSSKEREVDAFYEYSYLQEEEDIRINLSDSYDDNFISYMFNNSMEIFDKIEVYSLLHSQQIPMVEVTDYPKVDLLDPSQSSDDEIFFAEHHPVLASMYNSDDKIERYWVNECIKKLCDLKKWTTYDLAAFGGKYTDRLEEEADIKRTIGEKLDTNMFAYPVTLQHYVDLFWNCGSTVGAGRGSSCSGLNHYLLGITQLDPIEWELPFWRYLNKERVELGDIDLDLCPSKRPLILRKIKDERGSKFLDNIPKIIKDNCGCTLIATFGTETTKSAIQTACRGYRSEEFPDGIDVDTAQFMSSLIPEERGFLWSLNDVVYGDVDKGRKPVQTFLNEVGQYPGLLDIMMGIEGLISRRGSHASGVILFDEDPFEFGCFMKTPSGDVITQYDLHMCEAAGMTKYDFLLTEVQDKITQTIEFLKEDGEIDSNLSLREVYEKYLHPNVMDIKDKDVWNNIQANNIINIFQFDSLVGSQAIKSLKPTNILELADDNGLMRLMTAEKGQETPMQKYARFKNDISLWYDEMDRYNLTDNEVKALEPYFLKSYGVPPSQEQMMMMLMDKNLCNFSLKDANAARKIVGKKQMSKIPALKEQVMAQAARPELGKYIWECGIGPQMG